MEKTEYNLAAIASQLTLTDQLEHFQSIFHPLIRDRRSTDQQWIKNWLKMPIIIIQEYYDSENFYYLKYLLYWQVIQINNMQKYRVNIPSKIKQKKQRNTYTEKNNHLQIQQFILKWTDTRIFCLQCFQNRNDIYFIITIIIYPYYIKLMNIDQCIQTVLACNILPQNTVKKLCKKVKALLFEESNVQPVQAPVTVCGDIHGQFYDLLELFQKGGSFQSSRYIMIGDFVDRGYHSVQTITLLFLYKLKYPDRLVLLRGNHESRNITYMYGFYDQINKKYGNQNVWYYYNDAFDYLPIAAIIEGALFCVHGGLSPKINTIDLMRSIQRNVQIPSSGPLCDLMWSDPQQVETWQKNSRGAGWLFGGIVVKQFLEFNNLECIYRAHQLVKQGYKKHFGGILVTVWSAPNYCYRMNNSAAIAKIDTSLEPNYIVYQAAPMSKKSQNYANVLPYFL